MCNGDFIMLYTKTVLQNREKLLLQLITTLLFFLCFSATLIAEDHQKRFIKLFFSDNYLPSLSGSLDSFNLEQAYIIQEKIVRLSKKNQTVKGYKAGFTGDSGRSSFGLTSPVSGVLMSGCENPSSLVFRLADLNGLKVEMEIGYILKRTINKELKLSELKNYIESAVPVVELPQLRFEDIAKITGQDLVASNMASRCWIVGKKFKKVDFAKLNDTKVYMQRDLNIIDEGFGRNVGKQENALLWLVNHLIGKNSSLKKGYLLLTGKLGKINPGLPGTYQVVYDSNNIIEFIIEP